MKNFPINNPYGTVIELDGKIIRTSRNLRAIVDYASKPAKVELFKTGIDNGLLKIEFNNGATTTAKFASYHIMVDWVRNRRTWDKSKYIFHAENVGYLTKPGIIGDLP